MFPRLNIDLQKLEHNAKFLANLSEKNGLSMAAVTKVFCADSKMVEVLAKQNIAYLADSRLNNIESYPKNRTQKTMLLRLASQSEAKRVVEVCDISLNSELSTIKVLAKEAKALGKTHGIILMVDLGDLREGIYHSNESSLMETAEFIATEKSLNFVGIGVNLTCYGSVLPSYENLSKLCDIAKRFEDKFNIKLPVISGGNSSSLYLLEGSNIKDESGIPPHNPRVPEGINNIRLGEAIICGTETAFGNPMPGLVGDVVTLEAEIIELMEKPSMPEGRRSINAFGEEVEYIDNGIQMRAILAVGRQDANADNLTCLEDGVEVVGGSSDHMIVDVTKAKRSLKVGDTIEFSLSYGAILSSFTSSYVYRNYK